MIPSPSDTESACGAPHSVPVSSLSFITTFPSDTEPVDCVLPSVPASVSVSVPPTGCSDCTSAANASIGTEPAVRPAQSNRVNTVFATLHVFCFIQSSHNYLQQYIFIIKNKTDCTKCNKLLFTSFFLYDFYDYFCKCLHIM